MDSDAKYSLLLLQNFLFRENNSLVSRRRRRSAHNQFGFD